MKTVNDSAIEQSLDNCNEMLKRERSAVETYDRVIARFGHTPEMETLVTFRDNHESAVRELENTILRLGGIPGLDSGAWGKFSALVEKSAHLAGEESALLALKAGEESLLFDYISAAESETLLKSCKNLYRVQLIPMIQHHIRTIESMGYPDS